MQSQAEVKIGDQEVKHAQQSEFVSFTVAGQAFCLKITQIREIRRWAPVTILPHAPMDVLGVMNLRGAVIPIYDLSARFGLQQTEASERNVVIVVAVHGKPVGLLAESVSEIISINPEEIQDTPPVDSRYTMEYIQGIISHDDTMVRIINLDAVISAPEQGLS
ncbi:chemotaxis protein CheW [Epibacterium sp. DP7N7-1]|jgi:purine-binding chemotaxis protein CheW|uniref:Chemotaxis protein CheW n=1 Tax=Tritonibacter mobilis F1926 TaxID=1265309 RepID=A0A1B1A914_9RHOB|nr:MULTISPECIES: chemotaxis protein CheW [Rhodobacterales]EEW60905.1 chemotaxis protein CheW [Ruegeria sp. TrichCH4B]MBW3244479.1 chemotaxis protein CheW [Epibacterium sp. DP7N7-1]MCZ4268442.1 chemotaxis protein CheW [Rhodobacteraceae bacterium G21628-S1]MEE2810366.1 chemotaxis protein CheW [Pseudomonadota bacterium]NKX28813.1 purine-binding chemotaxis protein CheW [Rhodobacteraceae bacterium R_SAG6]NKX37539.1 purine-binding chemotaxis protein CheW [Rhodobacteraceae bacterium R_SAG4]NKX75148